MNFKIGDAVRVGGRINPKDPNYHKRGFVVDIKEGVPIVDMIEPFESGVTHIPLLGEECWELDPNNNSSYCPLLFWD